jgi:hypothetical protein
VVGPRAAPAYLAAVGAASNEAQRGEPLRLRRHVNDADAVRPTDLHDNGVAAKWERKKERPTPVARRAFRGPLQARATERQSGRPCVGPPCTQRVCAVPRSSCQAASCGLIEIYIHF